MCALFLLLRFKSGPLCFLAVLRVTNSCPTPTARDQTCIGRVPHALGFRAQSRDVMVECVCAHVFVFVRRHKKWKKRDRQKTSRNRRNRERERRQTHRQTRKASKQTDRQTHKTYRRSGLPAAEHAESQLKATPPASLILRRVRSAAPLTTCSPLHLQLPVCSPAVPRVVHAKPRQSLAAHGSPCLPTSDTTQLPPTLLRHVEARNPGL